MTAALYDVAALRAIETQAAGCTGVDAFELMRRAGQAAWQVLLDRWPAAMALQVVCGPGNNGGDGYVLATHALQSGRRVVVTRLDAHPPRGELAVRACAAYCAAGGPIEAFAGHLPPADVVVDALFGIGLARAPEGDAEALIRAINRHPAPVLALDVPSGVDAARGSVPGAAVHADCTVEFLAAKAALRTGAARGRAGCLRVETLGLDLAKFDVHASAECLQADDLRRWLQPRRLDSHKGKHGRVLCIGGEHDHGGAIVLATEAALRSGAGLVDVVTRQPHVAALLARLPEAMAHAHADDADTLDDHFIDAADVIAIGPGLGQGAWGEMLLARIAAATKPGVFDADALNLLAKSPRPRALPPGSILTPHPGEAARLLDIDNAEVQRDRFAAARRLTERHDAVVVLKGAGSIVAAPGRVPRVIDAGNPGMAVGGMGDVLTGVVASLYAQGLDAFDAASCGALLHAVAGDAAARDGGERGLLPSDLMPWLRRFANPVQRA